MPAPLLRPTNVPAWDWFERYNFQREEQVARLVSALTAGPPVILLSGEDGIGRPYLLDAAAYRIGRSGEKVEILKIDLEGFDEEGDLGKFAELQAEKHNQEPGTGKLLVDALVSALRIGVKGATGSAALLSASLSLKEPLAALGKIFASTVPLHSGERFQAREAFASLLRSLPGRVIVHVVDPTLFSASSSKDNPRQWLPEVVARFDAKILVVSCRPEDQDEHLVPGLLSAPERIELTRLDPQSVQELLDLRFGPNTFPADFAETLMRYCHGFPGLAAGAVWQLELEEALIEEGEVDHRIWSLDDRRAAALLSEGLLGPVSQALHQHPKQVNALWTLLLDAALCGDLVPMSLLPGLQALEPDAQDELADLVDLLLIDELDLFEDLQFTHPGFPRDISVARFKEPIFRLALLEHFASRDRRRRAEQIRPGLRQSLRVTTRTRARLFLTLAEHLAEADRDEMLRELQWWVGTDEADSLRDGLAAALARGELKPETLWGVIKATLGRWPPYRRLALLDAYGTGPHDEEGNPLGVPMERLGQFHYMRADLLIDLSRLTESLQHAQQSVRIAEAEDGRRSRVYLRNLTLRAHILHSLGDSTRAINDLRQALDLEEGLLAKGDSVRKLTLYYLGTALRSQGELSEARTTFEILRDAQSDNSGFDRRVNLLAWAELGSVLELQGDLSRAREILEATLKAQILIHEPLDLTLTTQIHLASVLHAQGDLSQAREILETTLAALIRVYGIEHPLALVTQSNLAAVLGEQGELSQARESLEKTLKALIRIHGPEHPHSLATQSHLGSVLQAQGYLSEARKTLETSIEAEIRLRPKHPNTLETQRRLEAVLARSGRGSTSTDPGPLSPVRRLSSLAAVRRRLRAPRLPRR